MGDGSAGAGEGDRVGAAGGAFETTTATLLVRLGSVSLAATLALFITVCGVAGAVTTMVTWACAPLLMAPNMQVMAGNNEVSQVPLPVMAETNATAASRVDPVADRVRIVDEFDDNLRVRHQTSHVNHRTSLALL